MGVFHKQAELIRGFIVEKMPKSPLHRKLVRRIFRFFDALMKVGFVAFFEAPLRLSDSEPEPDVMIVRGKVSDFDTKHPAAAELVVEVAISSTALDREKCSLYAEANVPEYWIVLAGQEQIEVHRQPVNGAYQQNRLYSVGETVACESVPGLQVPVTEWFAFAEES